MTTSHVRRTDHRPRSDARWRGLRIVIAAPDPGNGAGLMAGRWTVITTDRVVIVMPEFGGGTALGSGLMAGGESVGW
jgi:hypothetical protein